MLPQALGIIAAFFALCSFAVYGMLQSAPEIDTPEDLPPHLVMKD